MSTKTVSIPSIMYFVVFSSKTAFFRLKDIFPECSLYIEDHPQIEPLVCLREDNACTVGHNCMGTLVRRLYVLFNEVCKEADVILLYYKLRNSNSLQAGVFDRELRFPRSVTMNPSAWELVKTRGIIYQFDPSSDFFLSGASAPPEKIEKPEDQLLE